MGHDSFDGKNWEILRGSDCFLMFFGIERFLSHSIRAGSFPQGDGTQFCQVGRKTETLEDLNHVGTLDTSAAGNGEIWWTMVKLLDLFPTTCEFLCAHPASSASPDIPRLTHGSWRTSTPKWISWRKSWEIPRLGSMISHGGYGGYMEGLVEG